VCACAVCAPLGCVWVRKAAWRGVLGCWCAPQDLPQPQSRSLCVWASWAGPGFVRGPTKTGGVHLARCVARARSGRALCRACHACCAGRGGVCLADATGQQQPLGGARALANKCASDGAAATACGRVRLCVWCVCVCVCVCVWRRLPRASLTQRRLRAPGSCVSQLAAPAGMPCVARVRALSHGRGRDAGCGVVRGRAADAWGGPRWRR
jgi:hypothetical protein